MPAGLVMLADPVVTFGRDGDIAGWNRTAIAATAYERANVTATDLFGADASLIQTALSACSERAQSLIAFSGTSELSACVIPPRRNAWGLTLDGQSYE